ncbi:MAG: DUF4931 domain-containing protein [Patescibacteria group bacterium]
MNKRVNKKDKNIIAEFRRDLVSGDWILISSLRNARPHFLSKKGKVKKRASIKNCPFEDPQKSGNADPVLQYSKPLSKDWFVQVIPNKYPLLLRKKSCASFDLEGVHQRIDAIGFHEIVITRDHKKNLEKMSSGEITMVLKAYQERYKTIEKNKCIDYILIFHNKGELAGATVEHPHSQIVAMPITPPDVSGSISGASDFFKKYKKCIHCAILDREIKEKKRIVFQNKHFITINPYASRVPYETRIFPLKHSSNFEEISDEELTYLAKSLKDALMRISKALKNPDYNFFIHTSAVNMKNMPYYHWHIEILPRTYKWAGLELGTGIEVVVVPPERATEHLRSVI